MKEYRGVKGKLVVCSLNQQDAGVLAFANALYNPRVMTPYSVVVSVLAMGHDSRYGCVA